MDRSVVMFGLLLLLASLVFATETSTTSGGVGCSETIDANGCTHVTCSDGSASMSCPSVASGGGGGSAVAISKTKVAVQKIEAEVPPQLPGDDGLQQFRFTLNLKSGWNLLSFPYYYYIATRCDEGRCLGASSPEIRITENTCSFKTIFHYGNSKSWEKYSLPLSGMGAYLYGYWIRAEADCKITIEGVAEVMADNVNLYQGWNQIGAPSKNVLFEKIKGNCVVTSGPWKYNAAARKYEKTEVLKPGEGYFVRVANGCTLDADGEDDLPPLPEENEPIVTVYPIKPTKIPTVTMFPKPVTSKPVVLHRTVRDCTSDKILAQKESLAIDPSSPEYYGLKMDDAVQNIQTIDLRTFQSGSYANYACKSRKTEQCEITSGIGRKLILDMNFDEGSGTTAADASQQFKGYISNPSWVAGKYGSALSFDGNSYVRVPNSASLSLGDTFLIELWFQPTSDPSTWKGIYQTLVSKENEYIFRFANGHDERGNGRILSTIDFGAGIDQHANAYLPGFAYSGTGYAGHATGDVAFTPGQWYKMEMEYDGTYLILRVDGKVISRTKAARHKVTGVNDLFIGSHIGGTDRIQGIIDEVKIWSGGSSSYAPGDSYYDEWCEYLVPIPARKPTAIPNVTMGPIITAIPTVATPIPSCPYAYGNGRYLEFSIGCTIVASNGYQVKFVEASSSAPVRAMFKISDANGNLVTQLYLTENSEITIPESGYLTLKTRSIFVGLAASQGIADLEISVQVPTPTPSQGAEENAQ